MNPLQGRTALVTGAGRGLGRAVALDLSRAGARVVAIARSVDALAELVDEAPGPVDPRPVDLGQADSVDELCRELAAAGEISIAINNAAVVEPLGPSWTTDAASLRQAFAVNVVAPMMINDAVLPGMIDAQWGRIVNISSGVAGAQDAMIGGNTYTTTKAALEAHTINLAAELKDAGVTDVTANVYRPGVIDTTMQQWVRTQDPARIGTSLHDRFTGYHESEALITPQESAAGLMAQLIASPASSGQIWQVPGQ